MPQRPSPRRWTDRRCWPGQPSSIHPGRPRRSQKNSWAAFAHSLYALAVQSTYVTPQASEPNWSARGGCARRTRNSCVTSEGGGHDRPRGPWSVRYQRIFTPNGPWPLPSGQVDVVVVERLPVDAVARRGDPGRDLAPLVYRLHERSHVGFVHVGG